MKKYLALLLLIPLTACATQSQIITTEKRSSIEISESLYDCPTIKSWPNPDKLTDIQVAKLIIQLHKNNIKCKNSIENLHKFIEEYNKTIEQ